MNLQFYGDIFAKETDLYQKGPACPRNMTAGEKCTNYNSWNGIRCAQDAASNTAKVVSTNITQEGGTICRTPNSFKVKTVCDLFFQSNVEVKKPSTDKPHPTDGALFVTKLHQNIGRMLSGAKYGGIGAAYLAAIAGGATRSLFMGGMAGKHLI